MTNNLIIFGKTYSNVNGFTFTDTNNNLQEYVNTSDATATASSILKNMTAYVNGVKLTGTLNSVTITNNETFNITVPNGSGDTITFHFSVDSNGNTTIT